MLPTAVVTGSTKTLCVPLWVVVNSAEVFPQQLVPQRIEPSGLYTVVAHASPLDCARVKVRRWPVVAVKVKDMFWPGTVLLSVADAPLLVLVWVVSGGTSWAVMVRVPVSAPTRSRKIL